MSTRGATVFVSRGAIRHNLATLIHRIAPAGLLAVVKDDAYGHGLSTVLEVLGAEGVTRFGTLELSGAFSVRKRLPDAMIFAWVFDQGDDLARAVRERIDLGVTDRAVLERVAAAASEVRMPARVHLKVDSGLHRAGMLPADWPVFCARAAELQADKLITVVGLWTHLAEASEAKDSLAIAEFDSAVEVAALHGIRPRLRHVAASAAAYARADARFDLVRIGAFLYGIAPGGGIGPAELGLRPVMSVTAPIVEVLSRGDRTLATIAVGGADGILSDAAGAVSVAIGGARFPLVVVEATRSLIDVSAGSVSSGTVSPGDTATLFGDGAAGEATLQEWADAMGTIGEEIVTRLSAALPRVPVD